MFSFKCIVDFALMPVLAEVHVFPVCIVMLCLKVIFSTILRIFYGGKNQFQKQHS